MNTCIDTLSKYWKLCQISLAADKRGYEVRPLPLAQQFLQTHFSNVSSGADSNVQAILLAWFRGLHAEVEAVHRAQAGLCLRCSVSYPILRACQRISHLFGGNQPFTYHDLLPFVLNDDGKTLLILDRDGKTQLQLEGDDYSKPAYKVFAVEILRTFNADAASKLSLENWAFLQTRRHPELKNFLAEFGFQTLSDWALLNRVRPSQIEQLSERDALLVKAFHAVYRRDRVRQRSAGKCPDPSLLQLQEMLTRLPKFVKIQTPEELLNALRQMATQLRQYDIWSHREPLELVQEDGSSVDRPDLPHDAFSELDVEQRELLEFIQQQLQMALNGAIAEEIQRWMTRLQNSRRYASFAQQFIPGLQLYYNQRLSLKEIAPMLGMTSWDQARRILNPGELLTAVRAATMQQLLSQILAKAQAKGFAANPPPPDYLTTLAEQIEAYVDAEVFREASEEIRSGRQRSMDSVYAQQLRLFFAQQS